MTKPTAPELVDLAKSAAIDAADSKSVGEYIETIDEGDSTFTYLFSAKLKGYDGWRWSVTLFAPAKQEPTVSEVLLLPGEDALLAPAWVPWAERLADWKALQAELEAQAALDAAEAEDSDEDLEEDVNADDADSEVSADDSDFEDVEEDDVPSLEDEESSALADSEEGVDAEQNADDAGPRPPRFGRRNRRRKNDKNRKN